MSGVLLESARILFRNGEKPLTPEEMSATWQCKKRDGGIAHFDPEKIRKALRRCFSSVVTQFPESLISHITQAVCNNLLVQKNTCPDVETIQRLVIQQLWSEGLFEAAEHYQNYREEHRKARLASTIPIHYAAAVAEDAKHFPSAIQYYQFVSKFARWREEDKRRETWSEACMRIVDWFHTLPKVKLSDGEWHMLHNSLYGMETCCAMRVVQMAGPALERCHVGAYNCAYLPIADLRSFAELLYVLMSGSGCGFSVEDRYISQLPRIKHQKVPAVKHDYKVADSTEGWCDALLFGLEHWFNGEDVWYDVSGVRKKGARLKTKGGRACLTGDTVIYKDKKKSTGENTLTIAQLYEKRLKTPRRLRHIKIRCLDEATGTFQRNRVVDVIDNGIADVYEVVTEAGYRIKATSNHRFMNKDRAYQHLELFNVNDLIAVNGAEIKSGHCTDCGTPVSKRAERCRPCADDFQLKPDALPTTARQRKECQAHNVGVCAICERDDLETQVHHKDRNPLNNASDNLLCVCEPCHRVLHTTEDTFGNPYAHRYLSFDKIVSIEHVGRERVYDLCMEAPNHNFVANGFVSHNSGPEPLLALLAFCRKLITTRQGKVLSDIDCHDTACMVGKIVQVGGVRRAATISISDLDSQSMRDAKSGNWYERAVWRTMANNSAAYDSRPDIDTFMAEFSALIKSKSGERGIFNRMATQNSIPERRQKIWHFGMNPCGEIILRPYQFCNLSIVIARPDDTEESLLRKVTVAAYWGCMQKTATDFKYLRDDWKKNCEEEALLGVDITGHADCPLLRFGAQDRAALLRKLRARVGKVDAILSKRFGVNRSAADTCVKPSGDSSVFFNCGSGCSPWFADFIMRWVREPAISPVAQLLREEGVPFATAPEDPSLMVFGFPRMAPAGSTTRHQMTALDQLNNWLEWKENWAEHSVACTVYVDDHEWPDVMAWVYRHFDRISGLSFLPRDNGIYSYAPNEELTREQFETTMARFPVINWGKLCHFELEDMTESAHTLACVAGLCNIG